MANSIDDRAYQLATEARDGIISTARLALLLGVDLSEAKASADRLVEFTDANLFREGSTYFLSV